LITSLFCTTQGRGSELLWKRDLFAAIVPQAVRHAGGAGIPVTVKMRKGIDADHLTYRESGRIVENERGRGRGVAHADGGGLVLGQ
jgi:tRNA-dihydrouridine synthase